MEYYYLEDVPCKEVSYKVIDDNIILILEAWN